MYLFKEECCVGVWRGGLSSHWPFNLYVNDLIGEFSTNEVVNMHVVLIVDKSNSYKDIVLLSASSGVIVVLLKVCETYATSNILLYNAKKWSLRSSVSVGKLPRACHK